METSLKTDFAQIFSRCPKNLSCPKFGGAAASLAPPARTPMLQISVFLAKWFLSVGLENLTRVVVCFSQSVEWNKNARADKIVVEVMFFLYIINK